MTTKKIISVEWVDATTRGGWHHISDCGLMDCFTVGWLMEETKDYITVAATRDTEGGMISSNTIPKKWIKKRWYIK